MPRIGLVTVLFNSNSVLEGFFKSISGQTFEDYHLYLIDNTPSNETDLIIAKLAEQYNVSNYTHFKNSFNVGVAKGNNQGITLSQNAGTTHTLLLNNDIEFSDPNLFEKIYFEAQTKKEMLIIPKILFYDSKKIWMAGGELNLYTGVTKHIGEGEFDLGQYNVSKSFNYAPTCFMLIDNVVFKQVGLMDEKYFVYYDDTDFVYRCVKNNFKIHYLPSLEILHKVSSSTGGGESLFTIYYGNRNRIYFIKKNINGLKFYLSMGFTILSRFGKMFSYDIARNKKMFTGVFDGFYL